MYFESLAIKNFRNFKDIKINLTNKNVIFGMNDVGKTNFLYALRYIFDREVRKQNFLETDYYKKLTENNIEITVAIDISEEDNTDNNKLRARLAGAIGSNDTLVYIKLVAAYDAKEAVGIPVLYWGGNLNELEEMKSRGIYYDIDNVFNAIYIDAYVDVYGLFKKNIDKLLINNEEQDRDTLEEIKKEYEILNGRISDLSGVKSFEQKITPEYKKYRCEEVSISVKSEIAVKGLYSNIVPYIKQGDDELLYPTSGEGRKKLLVYSIFGLLSKAEEERKINLFLIEEPENHLHSSLQKTLSNILFRDNTYKYLFMTTHSSNILSEMDKVNLIRIYNKDRITSNSVPYNVPEEFSTQRKMLNKGLAEAIFANKVLLVEGPSEELLFSKVLSAINPYYENEGICILSAGGFNFKPYFTILKKLDITNIVKTDNDLRLPKKKKKYSVIGFTRLNGFIGEDQLPSEPIYLIDGDKVETKRRIYEENKDKLDEIREKYGIHLSRCSLEEDLDEVIHDRMVEYLSDENPIGYLQKAKNNHMVELVEKLTEDDCKAIYNHYNFSCLKGILS